MRIQKNIKSLLAIIFLTTFQTASALATDVISIPAYALQPRSSTVEYETNRACLMIPTGTASRFMAPLILPQSATITRITMEAYDGGGGEFGGRIAAHLNETRYNTLVTVAIASFDTGIEDAPGDTRISVNDIYHTVDNSEYSYSFAIDINNTTGTALTDQKFYKFIVEYEQTQLHVIAQ